MEIISISHKFYFMKILRKVDILWSVFIVIFTYLLPAYTSVFYEDMTPAIWFGFPIFAGIIYVLFCRAKPINIMIASGINMFLIIFIANVANSLVKNLEFNKEISIDLTSKLFDMFLPSSLMALFILMPLFILTMLIIFFLRNKYFLRK